jgi:hypothetical protein
MLKQWHKQLESFPENYQASGKKKIASTKGSQLYM